jgi:hypothetical protein
MIDTTALYHDTTALYRLPPLATWAYTLGPGWDISFHVAVAPNAFHRLMQRLLLGIRWKRL